MDKQMLAKYMRQLRKVPDSSHVLTDGMVARIANILHNLPSRFDPLTNNELVLIVWVCKLTAMQDKVDPDEILATLRGAVDK